MLKNFSAYELYTVDNKSKYFSNPKNIFKSTKNLYEELCTKETTTEAATTEFLSKMPSREKISN